MEAVYVRSYYLKIAHYFFFAMGIFSLTTAINFWENFLVESITFLFFSAFYVNASLWLAYLFYKDYEQETAGISVLKTYAVRYMGLGIYSVFMSVMLMFLVPGFGELIYTILFINYYYAFIIVVGAALLIFKPVRELFGFRSRSLLYKAKETAVKYSHLSEMEDYIPGTDPVMDDMLEEIWANKESPTKYIQNLESYVCENAIRSIEDKIRLAKRQGKAPGIIEEIEKKKKRYEKLIEQARNYEG